MAGHGAQKLFGWFGGHGMKGTTGMMESMGLKPGRPWAMLAGASEFGGGLLTALGLGGPLGPIGTVGSMGMATAKVHWGKPIWATSGGAEVPVLYTASALAIALSGPGKYSLDRAAGMTVPRRILLIPGLALAAAGVVVGMAVSAREIEKLQQEQQDQPQEQTQSEDQQAVPVPETPPSKPAGEWAALEGQSEQGPKGVSNMEVSAGEQEPKGVSDMEISAGEQQLNADNPA